MKNIICTGKRALIGRKSIRLRNYDYSLPGSYFVTICVKDRKNLFGDIIDGVMHLNQYGMIVKSMWDEITNHYNGILLDEFIVMPNHVHGIIIIIDNVVGARSPRPYNRKITLGNIIAFFKYHSTKHINEIRGTPGVPVWQRNYYDHIIRNQKSFRKIQEYISTNPERWQWNKENPDKIADDEFDKWLISQGS